MQKTIPNKEGACRRVHRADHTCLVQCNLRVQAEILRLNLCLAPISKRRQTYALMWSRRIRYSSIRTPIALQASDNNTLRRSPHGALRLLGSGLPAWGERASLLGSQILAGATNNPKHHDTAEAMHPVKKSAPLTTSSSALTYLLHTCP